MTTPDDRLETLRSVAADYARVARDNIAREYPNHEGLAATGPGQYREPHQRHPAFYGSLDWHSCVEMHWVLVRLLRTVPDAFDEVAARVTLNAHLTEAALRAELSHVRDHPGFERPYGWAWLLQLAADLEGWDDPDGRRWAGAIAPLADHLAARFVAWLPDLTYPVRHGTHPNTAFALGRALPFARQRADRGGPAADLLPAIRAAARRMFQADEDYGAEWEPSGSDFLSPALTEAELMTAMLAPAGYADWLGRFLPSIADHQPATIFTPAIVTDATDGQGAHLHGLNLSRAWCWRRIDEALSEHDDRRAVIADAATTHASAAIDQVVGSHYMVEHWLAAYALLYLTEGSSPGA